MAKDELEWRKECAKNEGVEKRGRKLVKIGRNIGQALVGVKENIGRDVLHSGRGRAEDGWSQAELR